VRTLAHVIDDPHDTRTDEADGDMRAPDDTRTDDSLDALDKALAGAATRLPGRPRGSKNSFPKRNARLFPPPSRTRPEAVDPLLAAPRALALSAIADRDERARRLTELLRSDGVSGAEIVAAVRQLENMQGTSAGGADVHLTYADQLALLVRLLASVPHGMLSEALARLGRRRSQQQVRVSAMGPPTLPTWSSADAVPVAPAVELPRDGAGVVVPAGPAGHPKNSHPTPAISTAVPSFEPPAAETIHAGIDPRSC